VNFGVGRDPRDKAIAVNTVLNIKRHRFRSRIEDGGLVHVIP
jgi:hypothetical protein